MSKPAYLEKLAALKAMGMPELEAEKARAEKDLANLRSRWGSEQAQPEDAVKMEVLEDWIRTVKAKIFQKEPAEARKAA